MTSCYLDFLQITIKTPTALLILIKNLYFCPVVIETLNPCGCKGYRVKNIITKEKE